MSGEPVRLSEACRRTLLTWPAPSPEQETLRRHYLQHLELQPDGWHRRCPGEHLTASALVCAPGERLVLLTLHAKIRRWLQTGGHIEENDASLEAAALREAGEESGVIGLRLDPQPLLLSRHQLSCDGRPTHHLDVQFLVLAPVALAPSVSAESLDVAWFAPTAMPEIDKSVNALLRAAEQRLGWRSR